MAKVIIFPRHNNIDDYVYARDLIRVNKEDDYTIVLESQEECDMFSMDFIHSPMTNFQCIPRDKYDYKTND